MTKGIDVVTVGHALVDIRIVVDRLPGPDEEAEIREEVRGAGGSAVNVSIDTSKLGGKSGIIAKIVFDSFGRIVFEELWKSQVDLRGLRISPIGSTGFSIVAISKMGDITIYGSKGVAENFEPWELDRELISDAKAVHIASLRLDTSLEAAKIAKSTGAIVSWDPGRRQARLGINRLRELLPYIDIVFLNKLEAKAMTGHEPDVAAETIKSQGPRWVVVKLGSQGSLLYGPKGSKKIPAYKPPKVLDETGAGDAFAAATLFKLVESEDIVDALNYASCVAGLKVSRLGSHNIPDYKEMRQLFSEIDSCPKQ
ncbi:MAG: carbohydrate kinase family protein [Desulfurococcales archaeon]|nr:carbohydrate kinase family protein [Desulfurococcales archaeon]